MRRLVPLHRPWFSAAEVRAVARVLASGQVGGNGAIGRVVEQQLARRLGTSRVLLMTSCTHACQAGLRVLGLGPGDEVILPSFSYMSMANAVLNAGGRPVFVDIEPNHLTIDPRAAEAAISPQTKAILAVHYAGYPCDMAALLSLRARHGVALIEDAAQAIGTTYHGRALGTIGDIGCLSFHETKNIVCGEGGALVTSRPAWAERADLIREKGTNRSAFLRGEVPRYDWVMQGDNYVLPELQAAILREQLRKLDMAIDRRRRLALRYLAALRPLETRGLIRLPALHAKDPLIQYNWHLFYVLIAPPARRDGVIKGLRQRGVESAFHFVALHTSPFGRQFHRGGGLRESERASEQLLRLPLYPTMTTQEQAQVIEAFLEALKDARRVNGAPQRRAEARRPAGKRAARAAVRS